MGGGMSRSSSLTDNVVDIAVNAATSVDMSAFANLNARNNISVKGCHNITIRDVNQTISGLIDFGAFQQAVQATSQSLNLDQVIKQQQEMIAQSINLSSQEMETATHNLTKINQAVKNAVSSVCSTSTNLTNNIEFEYCSNINATLLRQENAAKVIQNCVMSSVQSSQQYAELKQLLDQKSTLKVENSMMAFVYIILAIAALVLVFFVGIAIFGASSFKLLLSWRTLIAVVVVAVLVGVALLIQYFISKPKNEDKPGASTGPASANQGGLSNGTSGKTSSGTSSGGTSSGTSSGGNPENVSPNQKKYR